MNREELTKALTSVKAGLADKDIVEHSTSFVFTKGVVITYNDEVSVRYPLDLGVEGAVAASPVLAFLGRVRVEDELALAPFLAAKQAEGAKALTVAISSQ